VEETMKKFYVLAILVALSMWACEKKSTSEEIDEAVEAVGDDVEEAGEAVKDTAEEGAEKVEEGAEKVEDAVKPE
jgi:predicted small secreted protein